MLQSAAFVLCIRCLGRERRNHTSRKSVQEIHNVAIDAGQVELDAVPLPDFEVLRLLASFEFERVAVGYAVSSVVCRSDRKSVV